MPLRPCPACTRHVRLHERACPFCHAALAFEAPVATTLPGRLSRAAVFAFRTTTAAATLGACGTAATPPPTTTIAQPYGAPPEPFPPTTVAPPSTPPVDPTTVPPETTTPPPGSTAEHPHHHHHEDPTVDPGLILGPGTPGDPLQEQLVGTPGIGDHGGGAQGYGGPPDRDRFGGGM